MKYIEMGNKKGALATLLTVVSLTALTACSSGPQPAGGSFTVSFPDPTTIHFQAVLSQTSSFSLDGQIQVPPYGQVYFLPANASQGFTFGGDLNVKAFLPESWNLTPVTRLPTGAFFPAWMTTGAVEVPVATDFNVYLGVSGQDYLGVSYAFLNSNTVPIAIGGNYYDAQGHVVLGGLFYPPLMDSTGKNVLVKGGVFIGTNISQFLPSGTATSTAATTKAKAALSVSMFEKLASGQPMEINGKIVTGEVIATGPGSEKLSPNDKYKLLQKYMKAMKKAQQ